MKNINFEIKIPKLEFSDQRKFQLKMALSAAIIIGAFLAEQSFDYTFVGTLILIYFGISIVWKLASRIAATCALFFLICTPVLLFFKNDTLAETFAIYAYYFLVITVVNESLSLKRENSLDLKSNLVWADKTRERIKDIFHSLWRMIKEFLNKG